MMRRCMLFCSTDVAALLAAANASGNMQHQHYANSQAEAFQVNERSLTDRSSHSVPTSGPKQEGSDRT
jgi:hypothetical protein